VVLAVALSVAARKPLHAPLAVNNTRQSVQAVAVPPLFLSFPAKIVLFIATSASRRNGHHAPAVMTRIVTATQTMVVVEAAIAVIMAATTKTTGRTVLHPHDDLVDTQLRVVYPHFLPPPPFCVSS